MQTTSASDSLARSAPLDREGMACPRLHEPRDVGGIAASRAPAQRPHERDRVQVGRGLDPAPEQGERARVRRASARVATPDTAAVRMRYRARVHDGRNAALRLEGSTAP